MKDALLTGGSGFLGAILRSQLKKSFNVFTLARSGADIECDISNQVPILSKTYNLIIHAAGKAHSIPTNKAEELEFFKVNEIGTQNICKALEVNPPKHFVFISTVAVYGNGPKNRVNESEKPNPSGPYALSKLKAEEYLTNWCRKMRISLLILRLPLIAGPNPPGNLGKMIKALKSQKYLRIDGGKAKRSIVSAVDVALFISENYASNGIYNLTDQVDPSFKEIENYICNKLDIKEPISLNIYLAKLLGLMGDLYSKSPINTLLIAKMTDNITFSSSKASETLNWRPNSALQAIQPQ